MSKTAGRKPKFKTPGEMELLIDNYAMECDDNGDPMTIVGMALYLGFASKQSLIDYQAKDEFAFVVKKGKSMVEARTLARAYKSNGAGAIFYLKNLGYSDRHTVEIEPVTVIIQGKDAEL